MLRIAPQFKLFAKSAMFGILLSMVVIQGGCQSASKTDGQAKVVVERLTDKEVKQILDQAEQAAAIQTSLVRVNSAGQKQTCRMHIIVMNRNGSVMGRRVMPDAWNGSLSIAISKAYTAMSFSSNENALTTRTIGALSQPGGPLWNIGNSNRGFFEPGLIEFPGGVPLYKGGQMVGGIGVSGDGVEEDEHVAVAGARGFEAPEVIRIDKVTGGSLPYVK